MLPSRALVALTLLGLSACAPTRILAVETDPPGALVRLDDDVIGRTPLEHPFTHYGVRRVTLYLPGYRTWSEQVELSTPWHARFPIDLLTEVLIPMGLEDRHDVKVTLEHDEVVTGEPDYGPLIERARAQRNSLLAPLTRADKDEHEGTPDGEGDEDEN